MTFRNPVTFATQFYYVHNFRITDIELDFTTWNPAPNNMDGIHLNGGCRDGIIAGIHGTAYDDMVALNASDTPFLDPGEAEIANIVIDNLQAKNCHSAVRLLSNHPDAAIHHIDICNIAGTFYRYAIGITHFQGFPRGRIDHLRMGNIACSKARPPVGDRNTAALPEFPLIHFTEGLDIGHISLRDFRRHETVNAAPCIGVESGTVISELCLNDIACSGIPAEILSNSGQINNVIKENVSLCSH